MFKLLFYYYIWVRESYAKAVPAASSVPNWKKGTYWLYCL